MKKSSVFMVGFTVVAAVAGIGVYGTAQVQGAPAHGKVTPWAAMASAVTKVPGGKAISATYAAEGNAWMYDVIVIKGKKISEVEVDASTGKVGDVEVVTPEQEGKEMVSELNKAIGNAGKASAYPEKGEKGEADEKP